MQEDMPQEEYLSVKGLNIFLKKEKKNIVSDVDMQVKSGEVLGLIGESGSGKSMTGKCIMGLLNPRIFKITGSIKSKGEEVIGANPGFMKRYRAVRVGMIPQNPMTAFAPMLKIGKQLMMGAVPDEGEDKKSFYDRIGEVMTDLNLKNVNKIMDSLPGELSGGMLQRIMIAMTVIRTPEVLIADEITTAVDASSEYMILKKLEELREKGLSMIFITHDFGAAMHMCDRISVMKEGRVIESGEAGRVLKEPENEYTKRLADACERLGKGNRIC